jgi:hypothetical protein
MQDTVLNSDEVIQWCSDVVMAVMQGCSGSVVQCFSDAVMQ